MTRYLNYWTLVSFCLLIITAPYWPILPHWHSLSVCLVTLLLSFKYRKLHYLYGFIFAYVVIFLHSNVYKTQTETLFRAGSNITINGTVDSLFKPNNFGYQGIVIIRSINGQAIDTFYQPKIRLTSPIRLYLGDFITTNVTVRPIIGLMNGVGFDAETYALSTGIMGSATIKSTDSFYWSNRHTYRQAAIDKLTHYTQTLKYKGVIEALVFGSRDSISVPMWDALKYSGLSHLVAISGLHIGIVFAIGWWIGGVLLRLHRRASLAPFVAGLICACGYAWLAGFSLPTVRALIMCCLLCLYQLHWGNLTASYKWWLTLALLLCIDPFSSVSASLWLSMGAVAIILMFLSCRLSMASRVARLLLMQFAIVIAMAPLTATFFYGVSLGSLLYNLIFVPWFSFVIIPVVFAALSMTMMGLECGWLWQILDGLIHPVIFALDWAKSSWIDLSSAHIKLLWGLIFIGVCALLFKRASTIAFAGLIGFLCIDWQPEPEWRVTVMDVGHGLSVVVRQGDKTLVYDTGVAWNSSSMVEQYLSPYLQSIGTRSLDYLVISHFDNDHAGDWQSVKEKWQPTQVVSSQILSKTKRCIRGERWDWGQITIEALWPPKPVERAYNPHSCVLKLTHQRSAQSALFTGDIEKIAEWMLVRTPEQLKADVVLVPHHGSHSSSIDRFVDAVDADYAIASTAKSGRWDLPQPDVVKRYRNRGAAWLDTGTSGQITLNFYSDRVEVQELRTTKGQSWYRQMLRKGVE